MKNINQFIQKHKEWIYKKIMEINTAIKYSRKYKIYKRHDLNFKNIIQKYINLYSRKLNIEYNSFFMKKMKSKWASCSLKKNITINRYMSFLPEKLIKYVLFHELLHLKIRKHTREFFEEIKNEFDDYKKLEKDLMKYWFLLYRKKLI